MSPPLFERSRSCSVRLSMLMRAGVNGLRDAGREGDFGVSMVLDLSGIFRQSQGCELTVTECHD